MTSKESKHKYADGTPMQVGDSVLYAGNPAKVVFIIEENSYLLPYVEQNWSYLKTGIGVEWNDGTLFHLPGPDEDLEFEARGRLET